ncbi:MAG TPA: CrcB family protein [Rectinemataceae bacterium]|nr:CrcB family protein [Rectinemataceae bacterium]
MSGGAAIASDMGLVFVGGGFGAVFRWSIARLSLLISGTEFPWATLAVNLFGCLMVGFVVGALNAGLLPSRIRPIFVAGFIGGLTTFSAYAYGIFEYGRRGHYMAALLQVGLENILGIALVAAGLRLASLLGR